MKANKFTKTKSTLSSICQLLMLENDLQAKACEERIVRLSRTRKWRLCDLVCSFVADFANETMSENIMLRLLG